MTRRESQRFYNSRPWRAMSKFIRARDGFLCAACRPRRVGAELVHHKVPLSEDFAARLDPKNLTSLCKKCHREAHGEVENEQQKAWGRYISELRDTI